MAKEVVHQRGLAIRLACAVFSISESCYRYEPKQDAENETLFQPLGLMDDHFLDCTLQKYRLFTKCPQLLGVDHIEMTVACFQPATAAFRAAIKFFCDKTSE